ncbi:Gfo/Idh/MocA family oxidoreductase [Kitasatospora sp. NPDC048722]|uniref:Gfo/Idh/MocA family protein n=1 Tax=Kitasatospora sp. NPDC048722 TaxID=3155639 RepID=UPI0033CF90EB
MAPVVEPRKIRVGILGANPDRGWAVRAHLPALRALSQYEITAVGTSRPESARAAARAFGAAHAFTDAGRLAEHPDVDLVVVTVKVSAHVELVGAALAAGKHVYCEWPLSRTTGEAEALAAAARSAGVHHVIGLQARYAPALAHARELIAGGGLGRVASATVHAARGKGAGGLIPGWAAYTLDGAAGAGTLEVAGGHTLDAVQHVLGGIEDLAAVTSVSRSEYTVAETGATVVATGPDRLHLDGTLAGGARLSVTVQDAEGVEAGTRLEVTGTEGALAIVSTGPGGPAGIQIGELRLLRADAPGGAFRAVPLPDRYRLPGIGRDAEGFNVARLYARLARDLRSGEHGAPDFGEGVRVHRLLDAIRRSADAGGARRVLVRP